MAPMKTRYQIPIPYDTDIDGDVPAMMQEMADADKIARGKQGPWLRALVVAAYKRHRKKSPRKPAS